ncbi:MAG: adenylate kinase family protein [Candidatus Bathyarchaeia archaeon]|nr:adenylate kinase family protein [Candidatus Bathyarchaeota archaeon]
MRRVIVITGTPGVGKSSISKILSSKTNSILISLSELVKKENLYVEVDEERDTLVVDLDRVSRRIQEIISSSDRDVIIEGHFAPDVVPSESVTMVFVLRRSPEELKCILEDRHYSEKKISENLAAEILDVCLYDAIDKFGIEKIHEVDATSRDAKDIVQEILEVLGGLRERKVGIVDWLGKLEMENKLEEYLREF